jgi:hypothetical protein
MANRLHAAEHRHGSCDVFRRMATKWSGSIPEQMVREFKQLRQNIDADHRPDSRNSAVARPEIGSTSTAARDVLQIVANSILGPFC